MHRRSTALLLFATLCSCHAQPLERTPLRQGAPIEPVRLPGLGYLHLGEERDAALRALSLSGFSCRPLRRGIDGCTRLPSKDEPQVLVTLDFGRSSLMGVQLQVRAAQTGGEDFTRQRFDELLADWTRDHGEPQRLRRPGITATRHLLPSGTALLLVHYDRDPILIAEHVLLASRPASNYE